MPDPNDLQTPQIPYTAPPPTATPGILEGFMSVVGPGLHAHQQAELDQQTKLRNFKWQTLQEGLKNGTIKVGDPNYNDLMTGVQGTLGTQGKSVFKNVVPFLQHFAQRHQAGAAGNPPPPEPPSAGPAQVSPTNNVNELNSITAGAGGAATSMPAPVAAPTPAGGKGGPAPPPMAASAPTPSSAQLTKGIPGVVPTFPTSAPPPAAGSGASLNAQNTTAGTPSLPTAMPNTGNIYADTAQRQRDIALQQELAAEQGKADIQLSTKQRAEQQQALTESSILDQIAPGMSASEKQNLLVRKLGFVPQPKMATKLVADPNSPTGASNVSYDQITGHVYTTEPNAFLPRGYVPTETISEDPYGNRTVTQRIPQTAGGQASVQKMVGGATPPPSAGAGAASPTAPPAPSKSFRTGAANGAAATSANVPSPSRASASFPPLDADGHITSVPHGFTPQAVEAANQLLDGQDVSKLPTAAREQASRLARQYGWEQGKFTPKEQVMLREATTFLQQAIADPSLATLDQGTWDKMKLGQVTTANPDKEGLMSRMLTVGATQNLDPQQARFVQMYNQLVGTISGLSQLVRSERATEAQIERLRSELPNPVTTPSSADAKQRLQRLLQEVTVAMQKGKFEGTGQAAVTAPRNGTAPAAKQAYQKDGKWYDAATNQEIH
jgi:hypothetical protein